MYADYIQRTINGSSWEGVALVDARYHDGTKALAAILRKVGIPARVVKLAGTGGIGGRINCHVLLIPSDKWIDITDDMRKAFDKLERL